jgi:hypothetical protein
MFTVKYMAFMANYDQKKSNRIQDDIWLMTESQNL